MISWLVDTMLGVTLLMLLVLAVRRPVARFFGAGWAYALWLLPPLRLVLPPLPQIVPDISLPPAAVFIPALGGVTAPLPVEAGPGQWVPFLLATWAGGAVTFLIWHWLAYRAFLSTLTAGARPGDPPVWGGIETLASKAAEGPMAIGLLRRLIILPLHFSRRYNEGERRLAMAHELVHHRRGDIWWNMAGLIVLAVNWFNPIAWFAFHAFRSDQELACDAAVAKRASRDERHDYARALVKSASRPGLIAACPLNRAEELKHRLRMLGAHREGRARTAGGLAAFAALLAGGLAISNPARPVEAAAKVVSFARVEVVRTPAAASPSPSVTARAVRAAAPAARRSERHAVRARSRVAPGPAAEPAEARLALSIPEPELARPAAAAAPLTRAAFRFAMASCLCPSGVRIAHFHRTEIGGAPAAPPALAATPPVAPIAVSPGRTVERQLVIQIDDGAVLRVAAGADPVPLTVVQAAIESAMAESNDAETRKRLGRAVVVLQEQLEKLGMITTLD
jgi:beta-lactamase regulating signal transducer with metallopeptidase domain